MILQDFVVKVVLVLGDCFVPNYRTDIFRVFSFFSQEAHQECVGSCLE